MEIGTILDLANQQLEDIGAITWPPDLLIRYLNAGVLEIINLKPDAYPTTKNLTLVAGAIQTLPTGDIMILFVDCNMGVAGDTVGKKVTGLNKEQLDELLPIWQTTTMASTEVAHVIIDPRDTKHFYVFPPQPDPVTQQLRAVVMTPPTPLESATDTFPLDDTFMPAMADYLVYRALAEETTIPNALNKSIQFFQKFLQDLGLKTQVEKQVEAQGQ